MLCYFYENWPYLYGIGFFKKYLFTFVVLTNVVSTSGLPVYRHYCGGELEKVNYLIKGKSCCGEMKTNSTQDKDCCQDEDLLLKNTSDFIFKQLNVCDFVKIGLSLFCSLSWCNSQIHSNKPVLVVRGFEDPPPNLQTRLLISTSVLRI